MKFLTYIRNLISGAPSGAIVCAKCDETLALEMSERIAVLEALVYGYRVRDGVYWATSAKTFSRWVEECASLKFRLEILINKNKQRTVNERLTTENARLLNDLRRADDKYRRDVYGINNEGDVIGGEPAGGFANDAAMYKKLWLDSLSKEVTDSGAINPEDYYWRYETRNAQYLIVRARDIIIDSERYKYFGPIQKPEIKKAYYDAAVEVCNADE